MKTLDVLGDGLVPSSRDGESFFYGYFIVAASFLILLVTFGAYYAFGVFFKPLVQEFGWSSAKTSGAFSLASIMMGLLGIGMGVLTDRFGPRLVMTSCGLLTGSGYFLMSRIGDLWQLYLFYGILVGAGMGAAFVPLASTVARWFVLKRSLMTGIIAAGIGVGALAGPPLASWLIWAYGWRETYALIGVVILTVVVLSAQFVKGDPSGLGIEAHGANGDGSTENNTASGGFSLKQAVATRQFWLVTGMFICFGFSLFSIMVHIVPHAVELGISVAKAAKILATIGGFSIIGKVMLGKVGDSLGSRHTFLMSNFLMSGSLLCLLQAKSLWLLYPSAAIFGLAYGGMVVAQSPMVAGLFGLKSHGLILGILLFTAMIGGAIGPLWSGYIFDSTGTYGFAFLTCAALSSVGLLLTAILKPIKAAI